MSRGEFLGSVKPMFTPVLCQVSSTVERHRDVNITPHPIRDTKGNCRTIGDGHLSCRPILTSGLQT
ncbi:hypothetical protein RRG08_022961 [Elysia crispata]|uniref:Uncharacterized protein n=1 Tax=Elysia crispata TaxID=231223 RepID=A0AAE1AEF2_9GAST|nr:hypothetical protein RRG08_022961 [Elysia crispata]